MYKNYYQEFLEGHNGYIHLAAHSHHFWPDITRNAILKSWEDSRTLSDEKWNKIFTDIVPTTQNYIAKILGLSHPENIAFAPNTHELISRLISSFIGQDEINILTTTNEFHSFSRQLKRISEFKNVNIIQVDNEDQHFESNFLSHINDKLDLIFTSQVFYNSSQVLEVEFFKNIIKKKNSKTSFVIDGYHGFCAIPTDLSEIENQVYYLAGGYKYAQAGEGCCFLTLPKDCDLRPLYTGWFASFETLESSQDKISYSNNGMRFWGSTQDLTALYRFNAVWEQFFDLGVDIAKIHHYIQSLQTYFLKNLQDDLPFISTDLTKLGHFLTIKLDTNEDAKNFAKRLKDSGILVDFRGDRLRFGFGLYLDQDDIEFAIEKIKKNY